ncbi:outer membrane beta-barrel protein [Myroides odoratimimus]|uniref:outer membrane beta-barrel protein n=1 Tax=Myroides odoratimimus TaxID=76832 RepID=UPI0031010D97
MKKLVLSLVAVAAFGFTANAQETEKPTFGFQETNVFVEGSFELKDATSKEDGVKTKGTNFNFSPKVGYMLSDKVAVGVALGFGKTSFVETLEGKEKLGENLKTLYAGAFARYYFLELGQRFKTYAEVGVGFDERKSGDYKNTGIKAGLDLGMNYFVTKNIAISFGLGDILSFRSGKDKFKGESGETATETGVNLNVFKNFFDTPTFGLTYKF